MTIAADRTEPTPVDAPSLAARLGDRLNPILVKEVRQSLRGRYFKISFWITLSIATAIGLGILLVESNLEDEFAGNVIGPTFFVSIFACLAAATQILVPFSAFLSMGGEWDENTYDLLVLSNLTPRQIVWGKVQSAGVQSLLFYSSFGPFLVFAFLLRGVDLLSIFVALLLSFVGSLLLSCLAVAMSSFSQARFARLILMVLLAVILVQGTFLTIAWVGQMIMFPAQLRQPDTIEALGAAITIGAAVAGFFFAAACGRLAHPEENRSTGLRLMTLGGIAVTLIWMTIIGGSGVDDELVMVGVIAGNVVLALATLFFVTEPERLGRRVAAALPKNRLLRVLATPLLPGGARGLLFFLLGSVLITCWAIAYSAIAEGHIIYPKSYITAMWALTLYGLIFLGIPSAFFSRKLESAALRGVARVTIIAVFLGSVLLPALVGFLLGLSNFAGFEHPLNVFTTLAAMLQVKGDYSGALPVLAIGSSLCVLLSWARVRRAFREQHRGLEGARSDAA